MFKQKFQILDLNQDAHVHHHHNDVHVVHDVPHRSRTRYTRQGWPVVLSHLFIFFSDRPSGRGVGFYFFIFFPS